MAPAKKDGEDGREAEIWEEAGLQRRLRKWRRQLGSPIEQPTSDPRRFRGRRPEEPSGSQIRQARGPCRSRPRLILSISAYFGGSAVIPKPPASPALDVSSSTTPATCRAFCFRSRSRRRAYARPLLGRKGQAFSRTTYLRYAVS